MDNIIEIAQGISWNNDLQLNQQSSEAISAINSIINHEPSSTLKDTANRPVRYEYLTGLLKVIVELVYKYPSNNSQSWLTESQKITIIQL